MPGEIPRVVPMGSRTLRAHEARWDAEIAIYGALLANKDEVASMAMDMLRAQHDIAIEHARTARHVLANERRVSDLAVQEKEHDLAEKRDRTLRALHDRVATLERALKDRRRTPHDALNDALPDWNFGEDGP